MGRTRWKWKLLHAFAATDVDDQYSLVVGTMLRKAAEWKSNEKKSFPFLPWRQLIFSCTIWADAFSPESKISISYRICRLKLVYKLLSDFRNFFTFLRSPESNLFALWAQTWKVGRANNEGQAMRGNMNSNSLFFKLFHYVYLIVWIRRCWSFFLLSRFSHSLVKFLPFEYHPYLQILEA